MEEKSLKKSILSKDIGGFFKPTKVTWVVFTLPAILTVLSLLVALYLVLFFGLDSRSVTSFFIKPLLVVLLYATILFVEYLVASLISALWYKIRHKKQKEISPV